MSRMLLLGAGAAPSDGGVTVSVPPIGLLLLTNFTAGQSSGFLLLLTKVS